MRARTPQVLGVLYAVLAAGALAGCDGGGDTGKSHPDAPLAMNAAPAAPAASVIQTSDDEGDDEDVDPALACRQDATGKRSTGEVTIKQTSPGMVLTLPGRGRKHELWIRRKLPAEVKVTMTELQGRLPGVEITADPEPDKRWAILVLDISDCPPNARYVIARQGGPHRKMKSRTGTLDTNGKRVSGWIKGASGYILAQGIIGGILPPDSTPSDSTASRR